ncbi:CGNR zinc finger domain-containing protein [Streptomyces sp. 150FB]|uniref:CGNR zinc finger domain-containing protein n=1 Tax=Streptomyces sp. 150FB TaxID=1576605 RepID=UPI0006976357|nr:CGNR zinc finger domain-containing protein [Streptomyces sp. 150FB]
MADTGTAGAERTRIADLAGAIAELLNSRPHATPQIPDKLDDPQAARRLLCPFGLDTTADPSPEQLTLVRTVRADLMDAVAAPDDDVAWDALTEHSASADFRRTFSAGEARLHQVAGDPLLGGVISAVADVVGAGAWARLRVCGNPDCRAVFHDTTRSGSQRWHSYELCGNRANVAAHRNRKRIASAHQDDRA